MPPLPSPLCLVFQCLFTFLIPTTFLTEDIVYSSLGETEDPPELLYCHPQSFCHFQSLLLDITSQRICGLCFEGDIPCPHFPLPIPLSDKISLFSPAKVVFLWVPPHMVGLMLSCHHLKIASNFQKKKRLHIFILHWVPQIMSPVLLSSN